MVKRQRLQGKGEGKKGKAPYEHQMRTIVWQMRPLKKSRPHLGNLLSYPEKSRDVLHVLMGRVLLAGEKTFCLFFQNGRSKRKREGRFISMYNKITLNDIRDDHPLWREEKKKERTAWR